MDSRDTNLKIHREGPPLVPLPGMSNPSRYTQETHPVNKQMPSLCLKVEKQFVLLFKTYTRLFGREILSLLSAEFDLNKKQTEKVLNVFLSTHPESTLALKSYASQLTVPTKLEGLDLQQAKDWLLRYAPDAWDQLESGKLKMNRCDHKIVYTDEQVRFLVEMVPLMPSRRLIEPFCNEFRCEITKNLLASFRRVIFKFGASDKGKEYLRQRNEGTLDPELIAQTKNWIAKHAPHSKKQSEDGNAPDATIDSEAHSPDSAQSDSDLEPGMPLMQSLRKMLTQDSPLESTRPYLNPVPARLPAVRPGLMEMEWQGGPPRSFESYGRGAVEDDGEPMDAE